ncbi:MAG: hypothetical protein NVSMB3_05230 [Acidobacteriaceae bacterium]
MQIRENGRHADGACRGEGGAMKNIRVVLIAGLFGLIAGGSSLGGWAAQTIHQLPPLVPLPPDYGGMTGVGRNRNPNAPPEPDPLRGKMEAQQARSRSNERQKRIKADSDRLLALATQLKEQANQPDKKMLSVEGVKKAEEIERLAHSVKDKMKG